MSFNPVQLFKSLLKLPSISGTIERRGAISAVTIKFAPANYFRDFDSVENIPVTGNEFVIEKDQFNGTDFQTSGILRGDILTSSIHGVLLIEEVKPMLIMGNLVGYRIRTNK